MSPKEEWSDPLPHPRVRPWMSVPEGGWRLAGLGRSAAYAASERGELPTLRIGRKVVVPTSAIWRELGLDPGDAGPTPDEDRRRGCGLTADATMPPRREGGIAMDPRRLAARGGRRGEL